MPPERPPRSTRERLLILLLRLGGGLASCAVFAIFLPVEWMAATHRWLGLGEFPATTVTDYLTRSLSGLYAIHGGLLLALSLDVRRFAPVVAYIGWVNAAFGIVLVGIDLHAGMPLYWTVTEGPPLFVVGLLVVWLVRGLEREGRQAAPTVRTY